VSKIPTAVASIISEYAHTFTDWSFDWLFQHGHCGLGITTDSRGLIAYYVLTRDVFIHDGIDLLTITGSIAYHSATSHHAEINLIMPIKLIGSLPCRYRFIIGEHIWEYLQSNFGHDHTGGDSWRLATWRRLNIDRPMPELFIRFCDALLEFVADQLYSNLHVLTCPWAPDPKTLQK
jgi:hypothetical protein